jgi:tRNA G46 methylase TrmB
VYFVNSIHSCCKNNRQLSPFPNDAHDFLTCSYLAMDSSSVFVDLGCGRGRAVLQVAMHSPVSKAVGIELSESRLEQAEAALEVLQQQGVQLRPVELRHADLSSCSLQEGTHFYLCSTTFGAGICRWAASDSSRD